MIYHYLRLNRIKVQSQVTMRSGENVLRHPLIIRVFVTVVRDSNEITRINSLESQVNTTHYIFQTIFFVSHISMDVRASLRMRFQCRVDMYKCKM